MVSRVLNFLVVNIFDIECRVLWSFNYLIFMGWKEVSLFNSKIIKLYCSRGYLQDFESSCYSSRLNPFLVQCFRVQ